MNTTLSTHAKRWLTSIIAIPLLFLLIVRGGTFLFAVLISAVAIVGLWEYYRIAELPLTGKTRALVPYCGFVIGTGVIGGAYENSFAVMLALIVFNFLLTGSISVLQFQSDPGVAGRVRKQIFGTIYVPVFLSSLVMIRNGASGVPWIFLLLCVVFAGDIGAYYVGTYLGRHKLCPAVSPGKTIEGAIGGLAANLITGAVFKFYFLPQMPWGAGLLCFVCLGIAAQIGDLFESALKRASNVKDSGAILPGHGGILDRIDALLFASPVAYFFKEFILMTA